jgi:hypothetical protein
LGRFSYKKLGFLGYFGVKVCGIAFLGNFVDKVRCSLSFRRRWLQRRSLRSLENEIISLYLLELSCSAEFCLTWDRFVVIWKKTSVSEFWGLDLKGSNRKHGFDLVLL